MGMMMHEWTRRVTFKLHVPLWSQFLQIPLSNSPIISIFSFFFFQVLSALDILQPPHLDFFQEMYPFLYIYMYILDENTKLKTGLSFRRSPKTLILLLVDSCFRDFVLGLLYGNKFQPRDQPLARGIKNFTWKYRDFNSVVPRR